MLKVFTKERLIVVDKINGVQQSQNITKPVSTAKTQKEESSIFSGIKEAVITDEGNILGEFRDQQYELDFKNGFLGLGDTKITGNINGKKVDVTDEWNMLSQTHTYSGKIRDKDIEMTGEYASVGDAYDSKELMPLVMSLDKRGRGY